MTTLAPRALSAQEDLTAAGWLASLDALLTVPVGCPDERLDRRAALELLRCDEAMLDLLVDSGLPCTGKRGDEQFNRGDLFNLALYSRSRASVPEMAVTFALRWMGSEPDELFAPAWWTFSVEVSCGREGGCGSTPRWQLARPLPEVFGGRVETITVEPSHAAQFEGDFELHGQGPLTVSAVIQTAGARRELSSPRLRSIVERFLVSERRYVRLPPPAQWDYQRILPHGASTCYAASLYLEQECRAGGLEARTRRGWILGMLDLGHAWLEVEDDDGEVKVVDTVFALLAQQLAPAAHPQFAQLCMGSKINRLLPTTHRADEPVARHWCGGRECPVRTRTELRPRPAPSPREEGRAGPATKGGNDGPH